MSALMRGIRGATVVSSDTPQAIAVATQEVLVAMLTRNGLSVDDVVSVLFTSTPDLVSAFPASAAREVGFAGVPLICAQEIPVPGAMAKVVRILMHAYTNLGKSEIDHVYLGEAQALRKDLDL
jgi:chorismate mutase